jgi:hypothetical protein
MISKSLSAIYIGKEPIDRKTEGLTELISTKHKNPRDVLFGMYSSEADQLFRDELFHSNRTLPSETFREQAINLKVLKI